MQHAPVALLVGLAQPQPRARQRDLVARAAQNPGLEIFEAGLHRRRDRIEHGQGEDAADRREKLSRNRNCQTETPAARATTSSLLRVNRQNASIVPNNMPNGSTSCAICGSLSPAISRS